MGALADTAVAHEFPTLDREGLVYLDSSATSQTPRAVIDAMTDYYENHRASVHRGVYPLQVEATELFEGARERIAKFVGWGARETILTRNASEALNLVAWSWGTANVGPGDTVLITEMEHHSNLVPWQLLCERTGATLDWVPVDDDGRLVLDALDEKLARGDVKVVAVAHVSNVVGTINPIADITRRAHAAGAVVVVDGSQAVPQLPVDLREIDADFYAWTGHKAYGPTGVGVRHGRRAAPPAPPRGAARRDAPVHQRRPHDRVGVAREGHALRRAAGAVRGRHVGHRRGHRPRRGRRLPVRHRHGRGPRARARPRRLRDRAPVGRARPAHPGPSRGRRPRRARLVHARRRAPARRRRDPRGARRVHPRRPPRRAAADEALRRRRDEPRLVRRPQHARGRRPAGRGPRPRQRDLRGLIQWTTCIARRSSATTSGPTTWGRWTHPTWSSRTRTRCAATSCA